MRIVVDRKRLVCTLAHTERVAREHSVSSRGAIIQSENEDGVSVVAVGPETALRQPMPARVEEPGRIVIEPSALSRLAKSMMAYAFVTIESIPDDAGHIRVFAGKTDAKLACLDEEKYPDSLIPFPVPSASDVEATVTVDTAGWLATVKRVAPLVPQDDNRYGLACVQVEAVNGRLRLAATNGSALIFSEMDGSYDRKCKARNYPRMGLVNLPAFEKADGDMTIRFYLKHVVTEASGIVLVNRWEQQDFPAYRSVLPSGENIGAIVETQPLREIIDRCAAFAQDRARTTRVEIAEDGRILLSCRRVADSGAETLHEEIETLESHPERWKTTGVDAGLMAKLLAGTESEAIRISQHGEALSPITWPVDDLGGLAVLMPIRLD